MSWTNLIGICILLELICDTQAWKLYNRKLLANHYRVKSGVPIAPETYIDEEAPVTNVQDGNKSGNPLPHIQVHHSRQIQYQNRVVNTIYWNEHEIPEETKSTIACLAAIICISFLIWLILL